uniref:Uncharacterized protein n=1 Tax=Ceratitis capitata TaxID=7213 RepID=W8ASJ4_CERCA
MSRPQNVVTSLPTASRVQTHTYGAPTRAFSLHSFTSFVGFPVCCLQLPLRLTRRRRRRRCVRPTILRCSASSSAIYLIPTKNEGNPKNKNNSMRIRHHRTGCSTDQIGVGAND